MPGGRRRKSVQEAAAKADIDLGEYVSRRMSAQLKDALDASCKGIADRAKQGDVKAQEFVVNFFGRWATPEDPRDATAAKHLDRVHKIRKAALKHEQAEGVPEVESREDTVSPDDPTEEETGGYWPDDSDAGGEGLPLESDENPQDWGEAV